MNQLIVYCYVVAAVCAIVLYRKLGLAKAVLIAFCAPLLLFVVGIIILLLFGDQ